LISVILFVSEIDLAQPLFPGEISLGKRRALIGKMVLSCHQADLGIRSYFENSLTGSPPGEPTADNQMLEFHLYSPCPPSPAYLWEREKSDYYRSG
jgi:hypothetical protein